MGVSGGSLSQGAVIVQLACDGSLNQEWSLGGTDGAYAYDTLINAIQHVRRNRGQ